jgi:SAM-dependent methyltransferase
MARNDHMAPLAPDGVDVEKPSAARIYDWFLGGSHNYAVDREFGKKLVEGFPLVRPIARSNRAWLGRVVRSAVEAGFRQFLDLGSGVPTVGNVHEIVRDALPEGEEAAVVYVDYEEVAAAHARIMLDDQGVTDWVGFVQSDLRDVGGVLKARETKQLLDFSRPVCLLLVSVLHFLGPGDKPAELVARYQQKLAPGSRLAISHVTVDEAPAEDLPEALNVVEAYKSTSNPYWLRTREEIGELFNDWPLIEPGLVSLTDWHSENPRWMSLEDEEVRPYNWGGVAEKPAKKRSRPAG